MADENVEMKEENMNAASQEMLQDSGREDESRGRGKGKAFFHKKVCRFCANKAKIE